MSLRNTLSRLVRVVIDEAERNPDFEAALVEALGGSASKPRAPKDEASPNPSNDGETKRGKNRRAPPVLDPVQLVREGEPPLRAALEKLSLEQLRDIVADYGMDPQRLVMKWATPARVIDKIVEMSLSRVNKGSAFRKPSDELPPMVAGPALSESSDGNDPSAVPATDPPTRKS